MESYKTTVPIKITFIKKNMILTKEEIGIALFENGVAANEPFLWFGKDPETGELSVQENQADYNMYVRHLSSIGIEYAEELDLEQFTGIHAQGITAIVFKINPENKLSIGHNEFADFFNIEYDPSEEFIIIKIHYKPND